ncbi:endo alpha-1,4 polygalactosaminidase [Methanobacterium alcaliphilum]|uniref:endo alpha-1,4 polygalactosaminidase n=1 Tax=Methanobacterium alcaliphilum TaxID=392018 RepID=UPI00200B7698|nr:endo alpha-1,4 polygalactosaminidase [Methanobacterium alcaliphilum]MCK9151069.1 endo alpha-1,4 polygalactosaminidase [Methanobacterium alcaliphilum]
MHRVFSSTKLLFTIIVLFIIVFSMQLAEPASATQTKLIDKGSQVFHDYAAKSDVKYSFKTYAKGKKHLKIKGYNYYYNSKKRIEKNIYLNKVSKSKIKIRYNGNFKKSQFIKTRLTLTKYYWKAYRKKLLSTNKPLKLSKVKYWAYQLQNIEKPGAVKKLAASKYDLLVIEPTQTVKDEGSFNTQKIINRLKRSKAHDGIHRKLVLAYINIGEAEDYRGYWKWSKTWVKGKSKPKDWPSYILTPDPQGWGGNYPVAYWDGRWKDIVLYGKNQKTNPYWKYRSLVDEVLKAGFDGVYLDWVEGYENPEVIKAAKKAGKNPKVEMIKFIKEIRNYARSKNPNFIIIQQNAANLAYGYSEAFYIVDGIAQESIWYDWNHKKNHDISTDQILTKEYIKYLNRYKKAGKAVFNCEYAVKKAKIAYLKSRKNGFIPYCSMKLLDRLSNTPPWNYLNKKIKVILKT